MLFYYKEENEGLNQLRQEDFYSISLDYIGSEALVLQYLWHLTEWDLSFRTMMICLAAFGLPDPCNSFLGQLGR